MRLDVMQRVKHHHARSDGNGVLLRCAGFLIAAKNFEDCICHVFHSARSKTRSLKLMAFGMTPQ